jgi:hypothetical protein
VSIIKGPRPRAPDTTSPATTTGSVASSIGGSLLHGLRPSPRHGLKILPVRSINIITEVGTVLASPTDIYRTGRTDVFQLQSFSPPSLALFTLTFSHSLSLSLSLSLTLSHPLPHTYPYDSLHFPTLANPFQLSHFKSHSRLSLTSAKLFIPINSRLRYELSLTAIYSRSTSFLLQLSNRQHCFIKSQYLSVILPLNIPNVNSI